MPMDELDNLTEEGIVLRLAENAFLDSLTEPGMVWCDFAPDKVIRLLAVKGQCGDWTAYYETPDSGNRLREFGRKLPEDVAGELFPDWAKRFRWRP